MIKKCPECENEISWFIFALSKINSLHEKELAEFLFNPVKLDQERRKWVCSLSCNAEILFDWKDAVVTTIDIFPCGGK